MNVRQITYEGIGGLSLHELQTIQSLRASLKYDGGQFHLHIKDKRAYALTSKRISVKTDKLSDRIDNFPALKEVVFPFVGETIIACEVTAEHLLPMFNKKKLVKPNGEPYLWSNRSSFVTSIMSALPETIEERYPEGNPLRLVAFSALYKDGQDIRNWTYIDKQDFINSNFSQAGRIGKKVKMDELVYSVTDFPAHKITELFDPDAFNEGIIRKPFEYEGFVVSEPLTMRSFKIKKMKEADVVVMGYDWNSTGKYKENGWIKSIVVGAIVPPMPSYINRQVNKIGKDTVGYLRGDGVLVEVGKISGFNETVRAYISIHADKHIGRIVNAEYMDWTGKRMRHPRIGEKGFRKDQVIARCTYSQLTGD